MEPNDFCRMAQRLGLAEKEYWRRVYRVATPRSGKWRFLTACIAITRDVAVDNDLACPRCGGSTKFSGGKCYACAGKGFLTKQDQQRNYAYQTYRKGLPKHAG